MLDHAQILGVENIGSPLVLIDRQVFSGSCLFHHRIFPAAGMGAGTSVGISSGEEIAQQASAGIGNAHCPMDKALNFHLRRDFFSNSFDFCQGKFSGRYYSFSSQFPPEQIGFVIRVIRLCGNMHLHLGPYFLGDHEHSGIRNDQCVRLFRFHIPQLSKIFSGTIEIIVVCQDVCGHIDFHTMGMGKSHSLRHLFAAEIFRLGTQSESLSANVYSVCSEHHRGL